LEKDELTPKKKDDEKRKEMLGDAMQNASCPMTWPDTNL
jgi:hypothetical protein